MQDRRFATTPGPPEQTAPVGTTRWPTAARERGTNGVPSSRREAPRPRSGLWITTGTATVMRTLSSLLRDPITAAAALSSAWDFLSAGSPVALTPDLVVPTREQSDKAAPRRRPGEFPPDLAWPFYPFRQARRRPAACRATLGQDNVAALEMARTRSSAADGRGLVVLFPVSLFRGRLPARGQRGQLGLLLGVLGW